jgi:hypothetical protein
LWLFQWTLGDEQKQYQMMDKSKVNMWMMGRPTMTMKALILDDKEPP